MVHRRSGAERRVSGRIRRAACRATGQQFGRGIGQTNLKQMLAFYLAWPVPQIRHTLSGESNKPNNIEALSQNALVLPTLSGNFTLPW